MLANPAFDWDRHNIGHIARHDVTPEEVEQVFSNSPVLVETANDARTGELRRSEIGETNKHRVLYVVWTPRENRIRIVTAWPVGRNTATAYRRRNKEKHNDEKDDEKTN